MHYELLFPSLYLKASDLRGKDVSLTITRVEVEELQRVGGKKEPKPVVYFEETARSAREKGRDEKRLVMNKTNARTIAGLHGNETDNWVGKKITLFPTTATFGRQTVDAIRVRDRQPQAPPPRQAAPPDDDIPFGKDEPAESDTGRPTYDLSCECSSCGLAYRDQAPVNVATGMCDGCHTGEAAANEAAVAAIAGNEADIR